MTRNGNPSFSLLHISIRNLPLCSAETSLFKVTHDIHLPNLIFILLGSHCSTSAAFDSLISFFLREVFFFFFNFPLLTIFLSHLYSLLPVSHICCHFAESVPFLMAQASDCFSSQYILLMTWFTSALIPEF